MHGVTELRTYGVPQHLVFRSRASVLASRVESLAM